MGSTVDPLLKTGAWRRAVAYWRGEQARRTLHCERCGVAIDRKRGAERGPTSLDVGHVVSRYEARQMGWTDEQINALSNTNPECSRCNRRHGARLGNSIRRADSGPPRMPLTSESW